jgi:hypothetical protein
MAGFDYDDCLLGLGSDILALLEERLRFIERLYDVTVAPLRERKRMIEANEEPYRDKRAPEDYDGPAFEFEWTEADSFEKAIGFPCLALLNNTIENFVRLFVARELHVETKTELCRRLREAKVAKVGRILQYLTLLEVGDHPKFRWSSSPVDRKAIEDITFTRNAFMHDPGLAGETVTQTAKHFKLNPRSAFAHLNWADIYGEEFNDLPNDLVVSRENLLAASGAVLRFCSYLESCRLVW